MDDEGRPCSTLQHQTRDLRSTADDFLSLSRSFAWQAGRPTLGAAASASSTNSAIIQSVFCRRGLLRTMLHRQQQHVLLLTSDVSSARLPGEHSICCQIHSGAIVSLHWGTHRSLKVLTCSRAACILNSAPLRELSSGSRATAAAAFRAGGSFIRAVSIPLSVRQICSSQKPADMPTQQHGSGGQCIVSVSIMSKVDAYTAGVNQSARLM